MPCYSPLRACWLPEGGISLKKSSIGKALSLPCNKCVGCRLERARQWAVRLMHESECHDASSFITLTFDPEFYPKDGSLSVSVAQLFLKRLRSRVSPARIRFFLVGEYGEKSLRAHYHALIFGFDFPDKVLLSESNGIRLFRSDLLDDIWGFGFCSIGQVTFDSACYVAKYAVKKMIGPKAAAHYGGRLPEFSTMSRRPGIGTRWIEKFCSDVYPSDEVIVKGFPSRPPRFYDQYLEKTNPDLLAKLKGVREIAADRIDKAVKVSGYKLPVRPSHNHFRLEARRVVAEAKASLKSRTLE